MEFSEDFVLPEIEVTTKPVPEVQANDDAFYAAGSYGTDPVNNYTQMYGELTQGGYSQSLEDAKKMWMTEQDSRNKEAVLGLINDPSIPREQKTKMLSIYSTTGYLSSDIKDKYVQRIASVTNGNTHLDDSSQDTNVNLLPTKQADIAERKDDYSKESFFDTILDNMPKVYEGLTPGLILRKPNGSIDWSKTLSPSQIAKDVGGELLGLANFFSSLPNFLESRGHAFTSLTKQALNKENLEWKDAIAKGEEWAATSPIVSWSDWRLETIVKKLGIEKEFETVKAEYEGSVINSIMGGVGTVIQKLDDKGVESGKTKPGQVQVLTDAALIFGGPLFKGGKALTKKFTKKDETIDVRPDSPIDNTVAANPAVASPLIEAGIKDQTGQTALALGAEDPGVLVHKYVMPKTVEKAADVRNNPDLHQDIIKMNKDLENVLENTQFDPNVIDIEQRRSDITAVNKIINESSSPTYMQSNSLVNVADTVFEVKAVFGRDSNYFFNSRESVINAYDNIKQAVEAIPEDSRGSVYIKDRLTGQKYTPDSLRADPKFTADIMDNKQFSIEWEYKKEYDLLDAVLRGPQSVQTVLDFGYKLDISKIAQTKVGKWITPSGKFAPWIEQGLGRQSERAAYLSSQTLNLVKQKLGDGKLKNELATVVFDAQEAGRELFTKTELTLKFPKLSSAEINTLFEKQVYWRQINYFDLALTDRARRNEIIGKGYRNGLYKDDKYIGAARKDFAFIGEGNLPPKSVWDLTLELPVEFELDRAKTDGVYNIGGKQLVVLEKAFTDTATGKIYEYGLVGDKVKLDILPQKLIRRIPGYSPVLYKEHFFIDAIPKELNVNGYQIMDKTKLENYSRSVAAATTKYEADALLKEFQTRLPDHNVSLRKAREESLGDRVSLYEVHGDVVRNALRRGERLPSLHGPARLEDPLTALIKTSQSLARMDALRSYKNVFESYFIKNYKEFLPRVREGEFPPRIELIEPLPRAMSAVEKAKFEKAKAEYEHYSTITSFADWSDSVPSLFVGVADVLEKYKIPGNIAREIGNKNMIINAPQRLASLFYITLNVPRQWFVQTQPIFEMVVANPIQGSKNVALMLATRLAILDEAKMLKPYKGALNKFAHDSVKNLVDKAEFDATVKAVKESGLLQSVDQNLLVNQILTDSTRPLVETPLEKGMAGVTAVPSATVKLARAVGFDAAEMSNRLFMWLQAKDYWKEQNPGKNWNTPKAKEEISYEAWRLSGSMSRAGSLPYQRGALSFLMQFAAITQKQFLLGFQEGGSILTRSDRARLLASRALLWGSYGVIGGKLISDALIATQDPDILKVRNELRQGAYDRVMNGFFKALAGDDIDPSINFSKDINPYGESGLGIPYIDLMVEIVKLLNGDTSGFRFPAMSAIGRIPDTINTINSWFVTKDISEQNFSKTVLEASRFASGMDNWAKAQLMLAIDDKLTKQGKPLGLNATRAEAFAQIIGFTTTKEDDIWTAGKVRKDRTTEIKDMASNIHREIIKIISDPELKNDPDLESKKRQLMNSFLSVLHDKDSVKWNKSTLKEINDQVLDLDKETRKTLKRSLIEYTWTKMNGEYDKNNQKLENLLKNKENESTFNLLNSIHGRENP
jgi:hypothetical protein